MLLRFLSFVVCFGAVATGLAGQEAAAPEPIMSSIAVVDVQYILDNSLAIKDLRNKIESFTQDIHARMTQKELELKKVEEDLVGRRKMMSTAESEKEAADFNKQVSEAQKYAQQQKIKIEKANSDGMLQVHNAAINIIQEVCKVRKCNIVLPSSQLLYADVSLNITSEVLEKLNNKISTIQLNF